jgi:hypothetical protein
MDREQVFQWLQKKDFKSLISFLKNGQKTVDEDPILQTAVGHFFTELISSSGNNQNSDTGEIFSQLYMLHHGKFFTFPDNQFELIVTQLCERTKNLEEAFFYALKFPDNPICLKIIIEYNENKPQKVEHSQSEKIQVNEVKVNAHNLTTGIFNSRQERLLFFALINCYPNYFIYPNVALSTIINSSLIDQVIEQSEKRFFFNSTVDFVIINQFNDFKPLFAIELDSEWHRLNNQKERDEIKNKIFKAAGLPLYRIEHFSKYKTVEEFQQVVMDTIKNRS